MYGGIAMDILELMKKYGVEIAEDKASDFNSEFRRSFKSAAELKKVKDDLADLQGKLDEANETIENNKKASAKGSETEEKLKKEIEGYKNQLADIEYNTALTKGLTGIEFANSRVKDSVLAEIKSKGFKIENGEVAGLSDFLKDLYKKEPDTFKAVDANVHTWGSSSDDNKNNNNEKKYSNLFGSII